MHLAGSASAAAPRRSDLPVAARVSDDGFGELLLAALENPRGTVEIIERDDGFIDAGMGADVYFAPPRRLPARIRQSLRYARGRVLDIGAGAGRIALYLQERGHDVVAIDISPGAIEVCKRRGVVDARLLSIDDVDESIGTVDTIVMFGNNFGLVGSPAKAKRLLRRFAALTSTGARIIAESTDPYQTTEPVHLAYHARNRKRGRMSGQLRIRVRHRQHATPWFAYLLVSRDELEALVQGTGWRLRRFVGEGSASYVAVLEKA